MSVAEDLGGCTDGKGLTVIQGGKEERRAAVNFIDRHIGPRADDVKAMLSELGYSSLEELTDAIVPKQIRSTGALEVRGFGEALSEVDAIATLAQIASNNKVYRSFIGMGYYDCLTPAVIQRNILENPGWYTQYTPYQPEISQGRLEALLNFQTMVSDLTGLPVANSSLLDEGTAAAEAMTVCINVAARKKLPANTFYVSEECHPQVIGVVQTRAEALGIEVVVGSPEDCKFDEGTFGILVAYPNSSGSIDDYRELADRAHEAKALVVACTDLLALTVLEAPGEWGADIAVGNSQRFGVPLGYGGPHAGFFATSEEYQRLLPGRLVGVSKDSEGRPAYRLALQTREQHIRREKATSNICTAQVLLAIMAGMYGVYHGPAGIRTIGARVNRLTRLLALRLKEAGLELGGDQFFDTITVTVTEDQIAKVSARMAEQEINLRELEEGQYGISIDEATTIGDLADLIYVFTGVSEDCGEVAEGDLPSSIPAGLERSTAYLEHPVFNSYQSETEFLRYVRRLESKDLSLGTAMIPLGSCTMKLNATSEMIPVTWKEFGGIHPFAPTEQALGYAEMFEDLEDALADITGLAGVSLQPNAGSQGEYAGLLVIDAYHKGRGDTDRDVCLIPKSAHGTNPASAAMVGMKVVVVECDKNGNIDIDDLRVKAEQHSENLAALMVTYPSTHGVFEEEIQTACEIIHSNGGQVYMDGANLNALVGLVKVSDIGADVVHINLHKTFCIPHGGGGPGMGPIAVAEHLVDYLPDHPVVGLGHKKGIGAVSSAPWGSPSILPISWIYMAAMGSQGLTEATEIAMLNANYIAKRLNPHYPVLYTGANDCVAHECILDLRGFKESTGIEVEDVAKRLMDYGFHAPTVSFPVVGTLMIEPTESESKEELDRFCDAMIAIKAEIDAIAEGKSDKENNPLKNAPHTATVAAADEWDRPYSRTEAAFPSPATREYKFWPAVGRIDGVYGDRNLICSCLPIDEY